MSIAVDMSLPPQEALDFFREKGLRASFSWADMMHEEHDAAFTVAKMMDLDLLRDTRAAVDEAIANGETFEDFRKKLEPELVARGWWGRQLMTDPETGETREVQLGSVRRLKLIFRTNIKTSYAAGHWAQIVDQANSAPYLMYDAIDDGETRPEHLQWDGRVFRHDSPFWESWFPPNGWDCRCSVVQLDEDQLRELGKRAEPPPDVQTREWTNPRTGEQHDVPLGIDPGWDYHPGRSRSASLREQLVEKAIQVGDDGKAAVELVDRNVPAEPKPPTLDDALTEGRRLAEEFLQPLADGAAATAAAVRERIAERLRQEADPVAANVTGRGAVAALVRAASKLMPADWVASANEMGALHTRKAARGWQYTVTDDVDGRTVRLPGSRTPVKLRAGDGYIAASTAEAALHEFAHRVQHARPDIDDLFQELHQRRTAGKPRERLNTIEGHRGYRDDEVARRGGYVSPYFGKEYSGLGYLGRAGALEVMPMALDHLLARDESAFRRLRDHDRELFNLTLGILFRVRGRKTQRR